MHMAQEMCESGMRKSYNYVYEQQSLFNFENSKNTSAVCL